MTNSNQPDLLTRLAELEAANAELTRRNAELAGSATAPADDAAGAAAEGRVQRGRAWSFLSALLIIVALILAPVTIVAGYAKTRLTDTDMFVATLAPLAKDPAVQQVVSDTVVDVVNSTVDIPGTTSMVFDGLKQLGLPSGAQTALGALEGPAVLGLQSLVSSTVDKLVGSPEFAQLWEQALRASHTQLTATVGGDPDALAQIGSDGTLSLQLRPIVAAVKQRLVDEGVSLAAAIPDVNRSVVIAQSQSFSRLTLLYVLVVAVGTWLPFVSLGLAAAGILAARHRRRALAATSVALAVIMLALGGAIAVGREVSGAVLPQGMVTRGAVLAGYDAIVEAAVNTVIAVGALAVAMALVAWLTGPGRGATGLRATTTGLADRARSRGERTGLTSGRFGLWLGRRQQLVLVLIAVAGAAVILFVRPLSAGLVIGVGIATLVLVLALEFARRPAPEGPAAGRPELG